MPTPPDSERPQPRPVLEPVRVLRPRRLDGLAELMREMDSAAAQAAETDEAQTQELPRVPAPPRTTPVLRWAGAVAVAVAGAVAAAALLGFGCALLLTGHQQAAATAPAHRPATAVPPATASAAPTAATDPDGPGTLRQGDSGPEVTDLQKRLLRIPDVYRDGSTSGTYDSVLTAAVARFQLWYGISGDETGVYGDDTRRALESRTSLGDDS
ncbi:peptidoglycan-binding domain-containing protein [Streptomyces sp. NPDC054783]